MKKHFTSDRERKQIYQKISRSTEEQIIEELSRQVAKEGKKRHDVLVPVEGAGKLLEKISHVSRPPKLSVNELEPKYRSEVFEILSLLDQMQFLVNEAEQDYVVDCWLDIKLKYSRLPKDAKNLVLPKIRSAVKPLGKKFRI